VAILNGMMIEPVTVVGEETEIVPPGPIKSVLEDVEEEEVGEEEMASMVNSGDAFPESVSGFVK
jgi:hypothetical protein